MAAWILGPACASYLFVEHDHFNIFGRFLLADQVAILIVGIVRIGFPIG